MMKRSALRLGLLSGVSGLIGCAINLPVNYTPPPPPPNAINSGPVEGQACDFGLLFFQPFFGSEQATLSRAVREATLGHGGGTLTNVTVDYSVRNFILVNQRCTKVKGDLMKVR
jgi:hypothetical protein